VRDCLRYKNVFSTHSASSSPIQDKQNLLCSTQLNEQNQQITKTQQEYQSYLQNFAQEELKLAMACRHNFNSLPKDLPEPGKINDTHKLRLLEILDKRIRDLNGYNDKNKLQGLDSGSFENEKALLDNPFIITIKTSVDRIHAITQVDKSSYGGLSHLFLFLNGSSHELPKINPLYPVSLVASLTLAGCYCFGDKDVKKVVIKTTCTGGSCYFLNRIYNSFVDQLRLTDLKSAKSELQSGIINAANNNNIATTTRYSQEQLKQIQFLQDTIQVLTSKIEYLTDLQKKHTCIIEFLSNEITSHRNESKQFKELMLAKQDEIAAGQKEIRMQSKIILSQTADLKTTLESIQSEITKIKNSDVAKLLEEWKEMLESLENRTQTILSNQEEAQSKLQGIGQEIELLAVTLNRVEQSSNVSNIETRNKFTELQQTLQEIKQIISPRPNAFRLNSLNNFVEKVSACNVVYQSQTTSSMEIN
jgi:hypothetical protein